MAWHDSNKSDVTHAELSTANIVEIRTGLEQFSAYIGVVQCHVMKSLEERYKYGVYLAQEPPTKTSC